MCRSIVLAVDIEPAGRADVISADDPTGSRGLRITLERLGRLRELLEQRTGASAHFHWFLRGDAQIEETWGPDWLPRGCPELIGEIAGHQDGTGIHPHVWRRHPSSGEWSNDPADPDWVAHCVELNCRHHAHVFGAAPRASRMGDHWISRELLPVLRRAGIQYDLTVEPGVPAMPFWNDPNATGSLPDFRRAPRHPYLATDDPLRPAVMPLPDAPSLTQEGLVQEELLQEQIVPQRDALWMVPVSTTSPRLVLRRRYPFFERVSRPANLVMHPDQTRAHLKRELSRETTDPLVLPLRSGDLAEPAYLEAFDHILQGILLHPRLPEARFRTVEQAMQHYLEQPPASPELAGVHPG